MFRIFTLLFLVPFFISSQQLSSNEIFHRFKKLNVLGNVLYLAAHPDDENTRFISYCANEKLFNTGYLSLTRGDGGQNLIGTEIREELGIIRTQELLSARSIDGGQQFFTRANDFGYSKTPDETLEIWDKEKVLSDVVWVIRKFKPDVIVCRFPVDGKGGHGHHTSSALLAAQAFDISGDSTQFNEQLKYVSTWQPKRVVINTGRWWNKDISASDPGVVSTDIGGYNQLLGTSYNELAALSRSMHKTQGFGSTGKRGEYLEYFEYLRGDSAKNNLFQDIDFSWNRIPHNKQIENKIKQLITSYDLNLPSNSLNILLSLRTLLQENKEDYWHKVKLKEVEELILQCSGIYLEMTTLSSKKTKKDSVGFNLELVNRSNVNVSLNKIECKSLNFNKQYSFKSTYNSKQDFKNKTLVPKNALISQPYWLEKKPLLGTCIVNDQLKIGLPENQPAAVFKITLLIEKQSISYNRPLIYKWNDPVKGEQKKNWIITPKVTANLNKKVIIFSDESVQKIDVKLKSHSGMQKGDITIKTPKGWDIKGPKKYQIEKSDDELTVSFELKPTKSAISGQLKLLINGLESHSFNKIEYDHITPQTWFPRAEIQLVKLNLEIPPRKIGYLMGAGDLVGDYLVNLGYELDILNSENIDQQQLNNYDVIITGVRFFNVDDRAPFIAPLLLEYTNQGGNLIIQYNTSYRLKTKDFFPYPLKISRDRVTEENAKVTFLKKQHKVLNKPNEITEKDFDFWVQERGLYFPNMWSKEYEPILSWHDKNEEAKDGALLIAPYGKGYYTYTGISFFRQLPKGVSGAFKLLVNLISLKNE